MLRLLFSAHGRINRAKFWGASMLFGLSILLAFGIVVGAVFMAFPKPFDASGDVQISDAAAGVLGLLYVAYFVLAGWVGICLGIKRYHDQDKPGAWILIALVPVVGGLIYFIQAGCTPGTIGPNRFGADPLREYV